MLVSTNKGMKTSKTQGFRRTLSIHAGFAAISILIYNRENNGKIQRTVAESTNNSQNDQSDKNAWTMAFNKDVDLISKISF